MVEISGRKWNKVEEKTSNFPCETKDSHYIGIYIFSVELYC